MRDSEFAGHLPSPATPITAAIGVGAASGGVSHVQDSPASPSDATDDAVAEAEDGPPSPSNRGRNRNSKGAGGRGRRSRN